uniref:CSD domain-containing protein n=1 Tax=Alexandrium andersonii TaxID=327968 RepID=A0A7S2D7H5_9DINO
MPWVWTGGKGSWGKGKGWGGYKGGGGGGKGGGGKGGNRPPPLPEDFQVDPSIKYTGTVIAYYKFQGYGFISPDQQGVLPNDKVFVLWKSINSGDRYPFLTKEMKVQFSVQIVEKNGERDLQAAEVCLVGGAPIMLQDETDGKKTFVGGQNLRYTGTLKFFIPKQGYGYIKIDPGYQYDKEGVPEEIRAETTEMNCAGANPKYMEDVEVEFGIWVTAKGNFKAYNVTLRGGAPLPAME